MVNIEGSVFSMGTFNLGGSVTDGATRSSFKDGSLQVTVVFCSGPNYREVICSAVQCSSLQCSAVQCSAVQCSAVQCSAVQSHAVQCSAVQCSGPPEAPPCSHALLQPAVAAQKTAV